MQGVDNLTGDPIRLSAKQREFQREAMLAMLNAQTRQINTLTEAMRGLQAEIATLRAEWDGHVHEHSTRRRWRWR